MKSCFNIGFEVIHVLEPDVKTQDGAGLGPWHGAARSFGVRRKTRLSTPPQLEPMLNSSSPSTMLATALSEYLFSSRSHF
jgi:hypothetical protein